MTWYTNTKWLNIELTRRPIFCPWLWHGKKVHWCDGVFLDIWCCFGKKLVSDLWTLCTRWWREVPSQWVIDHSGNTGCLLQAAMFLYVLMSFLSLCIINVFLNFIWDILLTHKVKGQISIEFVYWNFIPEGNLFYVYIMFNLVVLMLSWCSSVTLLCLFLLCNMHFVVSPSAWL